jgi:hypothetical protein
LNHSRFAFTAMSLAVRRGSNPTIQYRFTVLLPGICRYIEGCGAHVLSTHATIRLHETVEHSAKPCCSRGFSSTLVYFCRFRQTRACSMYCVGSAYMGHGPRALLTPCNRQVSIWTTGYPDKGSVSQPLMAIHVV